MMRFLDYAELSELLAISPRHVRRLVEAGLLPRPVRFGRSVRFSLPEILASLDRLPRAGGIDVQC